MISNQLKLCGSSPSSCLLLPPRSLGVYLLKVVTLNGTRAFSLLPYIPYISLAVLLKEHVDQREKFFCYTKRYKEVRNA